MNRVYIPILLIVGLVVAEVHGQSTISNSPLEISTGQGLWGAFLPAYELGVDSNGSTAIRDDMDVVGYHGDLRAVRRFLGTRTSLESRVFYGTAESTTNSGGGSFDVPQPNDGSLVTFSELARLRSEVENYGFDLSLRDTWITRFGGLSAGCGLSYIAFDQSFDSTAGPDDLLREELDSDFRGGKAIVGWDGSFCGRPTNIDLLIGFYDMNADYSSQAGSLGPSVSEELSKSVTTIETNFTTRRDFRNIQVGTTVGIMYFSDMPTINHTPGEAVSLGTDDAVTLKFLFEILL